MTTTENYKGYKMSITEKKVIVWKKSNPTKQMFTGTSIEDVKKGIDSWERNVECSKRIDSTPQGRSTNINVIRK